MASAQDLLQEYGLKKLWISPVFLSSQEPNYQGSFWIVDSATNKIIGYAPLECSKQAMAAIQS